MRSMNLGDSKKFKEDELLKIIKYLFKNRRLDSKNYIKSNEIINIIRED